MYVTATTLSLGRFRVQYLYAGTYSSIHLWLCNQTKNKISSILLTQKRYYLSSDVLGITVVHCGTTVHVNPVHPYMQENSHVHKL